MLNKNLVLNYAKTVKNILITVTVLEIYAKAVKIKINNKAKIVNVYNVWKNTSVMGLFVEFVKVNAYRNLDNLQIKN